MTAPTPTQRDAKAELKAAKAYAKAQRPWYKKKRWILTLGFVLLIVIIAATGSSSDTGSDGSGSGASTNGSSGAKASAKEDEKSGRVGEKLTNAGTSYEVTSASTADTIGDTEFGGGAKADGIFVVVNLELTNNKDETKTFSDSAAKIVTSDGKEYKASNDAIIAFGDDSLFLKEIQPDLTTSGKLAFDVPPAKTSGAKLVVEDLFGSGEVTVNLGL